MPLFNIGLKARIGVLIILLTVVMIISFNILLLSSLFEKDKKESVDLARSISNSIVENFKTLPEVVSYKADINPHNEIQFKIKDGMINYKIIWSFLLEDQFGKNSLKEPISDDEKQSLKSFSEIAKYHNDGKVTFITPIVTDESCGDCHYRSDDQKLESNLIIGSLNLYLDRPEVKYFSEKISNELMIGLIVSMTIFSALVLFIIHQAHSRPIRKIKDSLQKIRSGSLDFDQIGSVGSFEVADLAKEASELLKALAENRKMIEQERDKEIMGNRQILKLIDEKGQSKDLDDIVGKIAYVVDEAERIKLVRIACSFLDKTENKILIPADPKYIQPVSVYLSEMVAGNDKDISRERVEIAIDEAISNAIYHGVFEIDSKLKEESFERFLDEVNRRLETDDNLSKRISVRLESDDKETVVTIEDEGKGFDYHQFLSKEIDEAMLSKPHGRGIILMKGFSSKMIFNKGGSSVSLVFEKKR